MIYIPVTYPGGRQDFLPYNHFESVVLTHTEVDGMDKVEKQVMDRQTTEAGYHAMVASLHNWVRSREAFGQVIEYTPYYYVYKVDGKIVEERYITGDWAF